eukprot:1141087-Pelagomonas_calceolata.AAC.11
MVKVGTGRAGSGDVGEGGQGGQGGEGGHWQGSADLNWRRVVEEGSCYTLLTKFDAALTQWQARAAWKPAVLLLSNLGGAAGGLPGGEVGHAWAGQPRILETWAIAALQSFL